MSQYVRNTIVKALLSDNSVSTIDQIVSFNKSYNDKVTKVRKPVAYKKLMKLEG